MLFTIRVQKEVFDLLGFSRTIKADTKERFIIALKKEKCVTLRVEVERTAIACENFKESGGNEEGFSYMIKFSAKNKKGEKVIYQKEWEEDTEQMGDLVQDPDNFLRVIEAEKVLIEEIKQYVSGLDIWIVVPKRKWFFNGGYEKIKEAINS